MTQGWAIGTSVIVAALNASIWYWLLSFWLKLSTINDPKTCKIILISTMVLNLICSALGYFIFKLSINWFYWIIAWSSIPILIGFFIFLIINELNKKNSQ